jgi:ABC-type sulfate/molybdate transport systems ATPase subunit
LREIVQRVGVTTIIVTHDQEEAWDIADNVVIFNKGGIEQQGTPQVRCPFTMGCVHAHASSQHLRSSFDGGI